MAGPSDKVVFLGVKGTVIALDRQSGRELWQAPLKGGQFVNLVLDGGDLFATTKGEVFCLDPRTGRVRWTNPLRGFGWGLVTVATTTSGASALPALAQHLIDQQQAAAATAASSAT